MNTRTLVGIATALVVVAVPSMAYHIDGVTPGGATPTAATLTAADWQAPTTCLPEVGCLTLCESEWGAGTGPGGTAADDRNANGQGGPGDGGLCTTGRNDASGAAEPSPVPSGPGLAYTLLDVCSTTTVQRNNAVGATTVVDGPYSAAASCAGVSLGVTGDDTLIGFAAEIGTYSCTVLAAQALVYDEWYAAMSYDGDASYTSGDAVGAKHTGDGDVQDNAAMVGWKDHYQAWTGHVSVFVNSQDAATNSVLAGSVATSAWTGTSTGQTLLPCGFSPAGTGSYPTGPVAILA